MVHSVISSCLDSVVSYWMKVMTQTLSVATYLHMINPIKHSLYTLNVIKVAAKKNAFHIFSVPVLNFITLVQQLTIKSARFMQLRFISIWQRTGLFTVKLRSVRQGWSA